MSKECRRSVKPSLTKDSEFWLYEGAVLGAGSAFALITTGAWDEGELLFTESFLVVRQFGREGFEAMRYTFKPGAVKVAHARIGLRDYMLNGWVQGRLEEHLLSWRKQNPSGDYPRPYKLREANPSVSALRVREAFRREGLEVIRANTSSTLLRRYVAMVCALDELVPEPFGS
jgi:hypothetical protein